MLIVMNSPKQVQEAVNNAVSIHEAADGAEITYVGHSLGGMEAAAASIRPAMPLLHSILPQLLIRLPVNLALEMPQK